MEENAVGMTCNTHDEMKVHTFSSFNLEESNCRSRGRNVKVSRGS